MTEPREIDAAEITRRRSGPVHRDQLHGPRRDGPAGQASPRARGIAAQTDFYAETTKPWRKNDLLPEALRVPTDEWAGKNGGG